MDDRELGIFSTITSALGSLFGGASSLTDEQIQQLSQNMNDRELSFFSSLFKAAKKYGPKALKAVGNAVGGGNDDEGNTDDGGYDRELIFFSTILSGLGSLFGGSSSKELQQLTQNMDDRELGIFSTIASALGSLFGGSSSLTE